MKIGIYGYGNLGRGVEAAVKYREDVELVGIFTRRDPSGIKACSGAPVYNISEIESFVGIIDVLVICAGSATDLPEMTPKMARLFNVVDSFDTHARIPEHFKNADAAARASGKIALISAGWDPGLFSIARLYSLAALPSGTDYTFWGVGISQGHSDAIRRIEGVVDARQYTVPKNDALEAVRCGSCPSLSTKDKHERVCYVVAAKGADLKKIEHEIKTMPNYFADYDTTVNFVTAEELKRDHSGMPHGGSVIRSGVTGLGGDNKHTIEFKLKLDSNPEFTGSVLLAYAVAVDKMSRRGIVGAKTVLDVAPIDLSPLSPEETLAHLV